MARVIDCRLLLKCYVLYGVLRGPTLPRVPAGAHRAGAFSAARERGGSRASGASASGGTRENMHVDLVRLGLLASARAGGHRGFRANGGDGHRTPRVTPRSRGGGRSRSRTCIMLYRTRPMDSFSARAKYCSMLCRPKYEAYESRWMFTAHSNLFVSA